MQMKRNRYPAMDLLKVIASVSVTAVHFRNRVETKIPKELITEKIQLFFSVDYALFIFAVPLFLLITGFLSTYAKADSKRYKSLLKTYLMYLFIALISYSTMVKFGIRDSKSIFQMLREAMEFKLISGWYIELYFGLFLLAPFLNILSDSMNQDLYKKFLFTLFAVISVPAFINTVPFSSKFIYLPNFYNSMYPLVYYFVGSYIRRYHSKNINIKLNLLVYVISLLSVILLLFRYAAPYTWSSEGYYASILNVTLATSFFLIILALFNHKESKIIRCISRYTLATYILSLPVDRIVYPYLADYVGGYINLLVYMPLVVLLLYVLTFSSAVVLTKLFELIHSVLETLILSLGKRKDSV